MQKWEYRVVEVDLVQNVFSVDGNAIIKEKGFLGGTRYKLWEYLQVVGQEGWEVVTSSPSATGGQGNINRWTVVLKRPIH